MHTQRLKTLAKFLETVPGKKFSLSDWRFNKTTEDTGFADSVLQNECGTTACAIGWACTIPEFQKDGLYFPTEKPENCLYCDTPTFGHYQGWLAVTQFFEINHPTADYLFSDYAYEGKGTPQKVIKRIYEVLAR